MKPPHWTLFEEHTECRAEAAEWDTKVAPLLRGGEGTSHAKEGQDPREGVPAFHAGC